jgi:predicted DNA-binding transcriptional regulator AlpA
MDLKVYTRAEVLALLGLSSRNWDRLEAKGDIPKKTQLSPHRIGYRHDHVKEWLDGREQEGAQS